MLQPARADTSAPLAWCDGGDIIFSCRNGELTVPVDVATAYDDHRWHMARMIAAAHREDEAAYAYHAAWERDIRAAVAARADWRRAGAQFTPRRRAA